MSGSRTLNAKEVRLLRRRMALGQLFWGRWPTAMPNVVRNGSTAIQHLREYVR